MPIPPIDAETLRQLASRPYDLATLRQAHRYDFPEVVCIDTKTYCPLKCEYCHPHVLKPNMFPDKELSLSDIRLVLEQIGHRPMYDIRPFQNGDPIFETRLHKISDMIYDYTGANITIYTNGVAYQNRELLRHPRLTTVFFTVSAATRETYKKVHGRDFFDSVLKTLHWLEENKYPTQTIVITLVVTRNNIDEIDKWTELFKDFPQVIAPLHSGYKGPESLECLRGLSLTEITEKYGTYKGYMFHLPCVCWNNITVSVDGKYLFCQIGTPDTDLGDIHEITLQEAWSRKMKIGLDNSLCQVCNMKASNYKEIWNKIVDGGEL